MLIVRAELFPLDISGTHKLCKDFLFSINPQLASGIELAFAFETLLFQSLCQRNSCGKTSLLFRCKGNKVDMNMRRCLVKMNDCIEHTQVRISCLKAVGKLPKKLGCNLAHIRAAGRIVLIVDLKNNLVVLLFLTAMTDMLVIVLDNSVFAFLLGIIFGKSIVEQLVIELSDVIFDNGDIVFCSGRVNIFAYELTVIVRQAVFLADTTADCSFFDKDCSFLLTNLNCCGILISLMRLV